MNLFSLAWKKISSYTRVFTVYVTKTKYSLNNRQTSSNALKFNHQPSKLEKKIAIDRQSYHLIEVFSLLGLKKNEGT